MNEWLARHLAAVRSPGAGVAIVLDRDRIVDSASLPGEMQVTDEWWSLRSTYERLGRRRSNDLPSLVIAVVGALATEPLPWDIERASSAIAAIKLPGPPMVRAALSEMEDTEAGRAIAAIAAQTAAPEAALLRVATGVDLRGDSLPRADQLRLAARLVLRVPRSDKLETLATQWVKDSVAAALLEVPTNTAALQQIWQDYANGHSDEWAPDLVQARPEISQLFLIGLMEPVIAAMPLDQRWGSIGIRGASSEERARELLAGAPAGPPSDLAGWCSVGEWWADLRRLVVSAPTELRESAWAAWNDLDAAFVPWLRRTYGVQLTSAARWPPAVHRIAHLLARRMRDGDADRVMLVVLDGLGLSQWSHLRDRVPLEVVQAGSTMALVPTYTTVSRQAIFAGDLPVSFSDSLWTTQPEPRRWRQYWSAQGFATSEVTYHRVKGRLPHDRLDFGDARVIGVVVNAVDDLMHSSELFGDAQLLANLDVWVANGFLLDLCSRAAAAGLETWITADHGNLECIGSGLISEGVAIESAGKRLLRYPNLTLRDASAAEGIVWADIPGMPSTAEPLLFARGRSAFRNSRLSISHGGLSFDEVIVPLARVRA